MPSSFFESAFSDDDRKAVDNMLAENQGKQVNVLIDSTGGQLGTGLSISSALKIHGNVSVHFVGLNASAATIASLGASHISMDAGAMYLVHKKMYKVNSANFIKRHKKCAFYLFFLSILLPL